MHAMAMVCFNSVWKLDGLRWHGIEFLQVSRVCAESNVSRKMVHDLLTALCFIFLSRRVFR